VQTGAAAFWREGDDWASALSRRVCKHSEVEHLRQVHDYAKKIVTMLGIPAVLTANQYMVAWRYSKCLTVVN